MFQAGHRTLSVNLGSHRGKYPWEEVDVHYMGGRQKSNRKRTQNHEGKEEWNKG